MSPSRSPCSARMAVDCVIESECRGACGELEGEASTRVHSGWEGTGSGGTNTERNKTKMERKCKYKDVRRAGGINRGRTNRNEENGGKRRGEKRQRMNESEMEKNKSDHPFWKLERGGCSLWRPSWFMVHGGCLETALFRVYFIMPRCLRPSVRNLILQRLITV